MKILKLRELSLDELRARGRELKQEVLQLRLQKATGQLENKSAIRTLRKENARIETIFSERRLELVVGKQETDTTKKKSAKSQVTEKADKTVVAQKNAVKKAAVKKAPAKKKAE